MTSQVSCDRFEIVRELLDAGNSVVGEDIRADELDLR